MWPCFLFLSRWLKKKRGPVQHAHRARYRRGSWESRQAPRHPARELRSRSGLSGPSPRPSRARGDVAVTSPRPARGRAGRATRGSDAQAREWTPVAFENARHADERMWRRPASSASSVPISRTSGRAESVELHLIDRVSAGTDAAELGRPIRGQDDQRHRRLVRLGDRGVEVAAAVPEVQAIARAHRRQAPRPARRTRPNARRRRSWSRSRLAKERERNGGRTRPGQITACRTPERHSSTSAEASAMLRFVQLPISANAIPAACKRSSSISTPRPGPPGR